MAYISTNQLVQLKSLIQELTPLLQLPVIGNMVLTDVNNILDKVTDNSKGFVEFRWYVDDVREVCPYLNQDEALEVLREMKRNNNAEIGVNWDSIQSTAESMYPQEEE